ncbi:MAG: CdaR family protein [Candidatus Binataceae bacterium]|jgi:hypothetical protein
MATPATSQPVPRHDPDPAIVLNPAPRRRRTPLAVAQRFRRNMGLRLISVAIAIGLWVFVNAGQRGSLQTFTVPIIYRGLPPGFVITNQHPDALKLQVEGPSTLLSLIDPARLALRLDLAGASIGGMQFRIDPDSFAVPRKTSVTSIAPSQLTLDIDRVIERSVPVKLTLTGNVANGYQIAASSITPAEVTIKGPSKDVGRIEEITTEPFSVDKAAADDSGTVDLVAPAGMVRLETEAATATVSVTPVLGEKQFKAVAVAVRNSLYRFRIAPTRVTFTLHGPVLTLADFNPRGAVLLNADSLPPGVYDLPVQIDLPGGVDLVRQVPAKVRLYVYHQKLVDS